MASRTLIVVIQAGWVVMGEAVSETAEKISLANASVIRVWGTTKGLGEIALNGPTAETILDPCGDLEVNRAAVLFTILCKHAMPS